MMRGAVFLSAVLVADMLVNLLLGQVGFRHILKLGAKVCSGEGLCWVPRTPEF